MVIERFFPNRIISIEDNCIQMGHPVYEHCFTQICKHKLFDTSENFLDHIKIDLEVQRYCLCLEYYNRFWQQMYIDEVASLIGYSVGYY